MRTRLTMLALVATAAHAAAHGRGESFAAGDPAWSRTPSRTITLVIEEHPDGTMSFGSSRIEATLGETIVFVVRNAGKARHEFRLDSIAGNTAHKAMMAEMPGMTHHDCNAVSLAPGEQRRLAWRFSKPGSFEFACLLPGHYEAGMHGTIVVAR